SWRLAGSLFYQGVIIAGFNFIANMRLLKTYRPSALAAFALTTPVFGVIATALVLGEPVGGALALSTLLAAAAVAIALAALAASAGAQGVTALQAEAARLLRELAALRGTPPGGAPPPIVIRTREQRRQYVTAEFARKYSPARLEAERRAMVAWGLVPPEFDLAGFL